MLNRHQLEVEQLQQDFTVGKQSFKKGSSYLVRMQQPQYKIIQTFFETIPEYKDSLFYDITAWTMTMAMGLKSQALTAAQLNTVKASSVTAWTGTKGKMPADSSAYAYAFEWTEFYAPRMLNNLLKQGIVVRVATKPFTIGVEGKPKSFPAGSIVIPVQLQTGGRNTLHELLKKEAAVSNVEDKGETDHAE